ncbi:helix-hairpin-helix domain-containing protein [Halorubrum sp. CBA1125]|uniref:helix-hairpin-helix domain-containing protein n=1 Tax=Halorubrum sp. CBA1125 TaxID=2668072 RepID=UPI0012E9466D|nr:helix-hairpin-helix domain-containing protein [Halorubrum sp. CBA1125]MUW15881.1 helix-hairpin-helix domain-containing protein [Halorubrum sp. CBA1125]
MALLQKLKEKLGFGSGPTEREDTNAEVTVEHEPEAAAGSTDEAVPGADEAVSDDDEAADDSSAVAAETDAAASTESLVDEEAASDPDEAAEPAEAAEPIETAEDESDETAVDEDDAGADVENLKGIGPAYAERLAEIGIETVEDLAAADPGAVAEGANVGEKRAQTWIERAGEF